MKSDNRFFVMGDDRITSIDSRSNAIGSIMVFGTVVLLITRKRMSKSE